MQEMQEMRVWSLGGEGPPKEEMAGVPGMAKSQTWLSDWTHTYTWKRKPGGRKSIVTALAEMKEQKDDGRKHHQGRGGRKVDTERTGPPTSALIMLPPIILLPLVSASAGQCSSTWYSCLLTFSSTCVFSRSVVSDSAIPQVWLFCLIFFFFFFKYQVSLFLGLIFNLWLQIICHYLENKRSHYLHSSLQPQSYTLFSYKIRVGRGLRRYTEDKSKREQTLLQA